MIYSSLNTSVLGGIPSLSIHGSTSRVRLYIINNFKDLHVNVPTRRLLL